MGSVERARWACPAYWQLATFPADQLVDDASRRDGRASSTTNLSRGFVESRPFGNYCFISRSIEERSLAEPHGSTTAIVQVAVCVDSRAVRRLTESQMGAGRLAGRNVLEIASLNYHMTCIAHSRALLFQFVDRAAIRVQWATALRPIFDQSHSVATAEFY